MDSWIKLKHPEPRHFNGYMLHYVQCYQSKRTGNDHSNGPNVSYWRAVKGGKMVDSCLTVSGLKRLIKQRIIRDGH